MSMTESLTIFNYPNERVAEMCNAAVGTIRAQNKRLIDGITKIGECLIWVKEALGHGMFCDWLDFHFHMSISTAENYMNASLAVAHFPNLWEYDPSVLYLFTRSLPERAASAIVEAGPLPVEEARNLIMKCKADEWYDEIEELIARDPGAALHRISFAMGDSNLRKRAKELMDKYADTFAWLSGREEWEVKKEAGMDLAERFPSHVPTHIPASLFLSEGVNNHRIALWVDGNDPEDIVIMPRPKSAVGRSWQNAILEVLLENEKLKVRTADDVC